MAQLLIDGLQDCQAIVKPHWDSTFNAQTGRDGSSNGAGGGGTNTTRTLTLPSAAATCIAAFALFTNGTTVLGQTAQPFFRFVRSGTTELVLIINSSGFIEVRRSTGTGTLLGTTSGHTPITGNVWYHLQVKALLATGTGGSVEVVLNGVTVLTVTGAATSGTSGSVTALIVAFPGASNAVFFDDIYVNDATGSSPYNDYMGDLSVRTLIPSSDGAAAAWTPSTGTNHAALVDEVPPNTTDYNASSTSTQQDLYNVADLPANATDVYAVQVCVYAAKSDAGAAGIKPLVRESSTTTAQSSQPLSTTFAAYYGALLTARPSDSAAWTITDANALQVGVEAA